MSPLSRFVFLFALAPTAAAQASFSVIEGPYTSSEPTDLDATGDLVVGLEQTVVATGLRWDAPMVPSCLPPPQGGAGTARANGVSSDGGVIVGAANGNFGRQAVRWVGAAVPVALGVLPGGALSEARGADADGDVVVGDAAVPIGREAFRWTVGGGMVGLGHLDPASFWGSALATSADGAAVVGYDLRPGVAEAFRWTSGGGLAGLGHLPGPGTTSSAVDCSADGSVVVGVSDDAAGYSAFRWTGAGGMVSLGDLPGGIHGSSASGVSADGSIVSGAGHTAAGPEAFLWTTTGGMRNLRDLLVQNGATGLAGWRLLDGRVSADGNAFLGAAQPPGGVPVVHYLAFLVTPCFPVNPERACAPAVPNSSGQSAQVLATGCRNVIRNNLGLVASQLPPNQFGYFLASRSVIPIPQPGGSQGVLCVGNRVTRFLGQLQSSGPGGGLSATVDLANLPPGPTPAILPGETWTFQAWFRDRNPGPTSNFTDAVSVTFE